MCCLAPLPTLAADGRHLDAYDTVAAQYWPAVQDFVYSLPPAQPLPPLAEQPEAEQPEEEQLAAEQQQEGATAAAKKDE